MDVAADGGGAESELTSGFTARGGAPLGQVYFVNPEGVPLEPRPGCVSSLHFPYGGAGPAFDPGCYSADAIPVQSYRHSHYGKERVGLTLDGDWFGNSPVAGTGFVPDSGPKTAGATWAGTGTRSWTRGSLITSTKRLTGVSTTGSSRKR